MVEFQCDLKKIDTSTVRNTSPTEIKHNWQAAQLLRLNTCYLCRIIFSHNLSLLKAKSAHVELKEAHQAAKTQIDVEVLAPQQPKIFQFARKYSGKTQGFNTLVVLMWNLWNSVGVGGHREVDIRQWSMAALRKSEEAVVQEPI